MIKEKQHQFLRVYGQLRAKQERGGRPFTAEAIEELGQLLMEAHKAVCAGSEARRVSKG